MFINPYIQTERRGDTWGTFLNFPHPEEMSMKAAVEKTFQSGQRHDYLSLRGENRVFDEYALIIAGSDFPAEDQCSEIWYFDVFLHFLKNFGKTRHLVEVGCYTGGSACWLYVASRLFGFSYDLVDVNRAYLSYTKARLEAVFGEIGPNVRFFHGDLSTWVEHVGLVEKPSDLTVHHDGSHTFNECLIDFASLSFLRDQLLHLIVQDTDLRSARLHSYIFVDSALHAVFGDYSFTPIGAQRVDSGPLMWDARIYFDPARSEGQILDMQNVEFRYPHRDVQARDFFSTLHGGDC